MFCVQTGRRIYIWRWSLPGCMSSSNVLFRTPLRRWDHHFTWSSEPLLYTWRKGINPRKPHTHTFCLDLVTLRMLGWRIYQLSYASSCWLLHWHKCRGSCGSSCKSCRLIRKYTYKMCICKMSRLRLWRLKQNLDSQALIYWSSNVRISGVSIIFRLAMWSNFPAVFSSQIFLPGGVQGNFSFVFRAFMCCH